MALTSAGAGSALPNITAESKVVEESWLTIITTISSLPAGALTILFVATVNSNQQSRHNLLLDLLGEQAALPH
jgi:hypothetical protein